jgi:hypothetical protein
MSDKMILLYMIPIYVICSLLRFGVKVLTLSQKKECYVWRI